MFIFLSQTTKISFKFIPIPIYRDINVFTRKEMIFYALPMKIRTLAFRQTQLANDENRPIEHRIRQAIWHYTDPSR